MTSVVISAHNESAVIGRCLDALLAQAESDELHIVVAANGCTDDTAQIAATRPGVRVLELPNPGKAGALNAADAVATGFPRIYLDADIELPTASVRRLVAALDEASPGGVLAVVPRREPDVRGRPWPVRGYFAVNRHIPAFENALIGRGVIVLSEQGRSRFDRFPDMFADDLFLDGLFTEGERRQVDDVISSVATPRRTSDLVRRLARVRRANAALRASWPTGLPARAVRQPDRWSWLTDVVRPRPWLVPAAGCYLAITVLAAVKARSGEGSGWGRDESTRVPDAEGTDSMSRG